MSMEILRKEKVTVFKEKRFKKLKIKKIWSCFLQRHKTVQCHHVTKLHELHFCRRHNSIFIFLKFLLTVCAGLDTSFVKTQLKKIV